MTRWWLPLPAVAMLAGCSGGTSPGSVASPPVSRAVNVNVDNPVLIVADNSPVGSRGTLSLVWSDEFNATRLDPDRWFFETGDGGQYGNPGWGNDELQWYLPDNAELVDGRLVITARRESSNGSDYTSARLTTRDRFAFRYGRIEARIRLPGGQGLWPAFWLMPQDNAYGGWAASGEIDIMEAINLGGSGDNIVHGTIHYGGSWPDNVHSGSQYIVPTDARSDFHDYALEWDEAELRWYVDGVPYATQNSWSTAGAPFPAPFDQPFHLILNVAVGGTWPGAPDSTTAFPATMEVDYVRVWSGEP